MDKFKSILKKLPIKFIITNLFFIVSLMILYLSNGISLWTLGFLFDVSFFIGLVSLVYFITGNNLAKNILLTIIGFIFTFLYNVDYIYHGKFGRFASASSLANADMVLDNFGAYEINIDIINIILFALFALFVVFLFVLKNKKQSFKERVLYIIPSLSSCLN